MKKVLITGGNKGIGLAATKLFLEAGYKVIVVARDFEKFPYGDNPNVDIVHFDVSEIDKIPALAEKIGDIDVLINNAGISSFQLLQDVSTELWEHTVNTNLRGAFFYIRQCLPQMVSRQKGVILNISSIWGMVGSSCEVLYSTTKAALIGMTKAPQASVSTALPPGSLIPK